MGLLESIRRWIDGADLDDSLAELDERKRPQRVWEEFLIRIAREVEAVMQREMFTPPGGPTYLPREYIVYLSNEDDKEWRGDKRRGLEQGLRHILAERARELSGRTQLATCSFVVELRVDGTLNKGEFRVQPIWDETEAGRTTVLPRQQIAQTESFQSDLGSSESETTIVRPRPIELYSIEIWRNGIRQAIVPIAKAEISIGRGSRSIAVDLPITGDPEVSRLHAILSRDDQGRFWLTAKGRNPTLVNGREIPREEPTAISPDEKIEICSFTLIIKPKDFEAHRQEP
jgi:hypothetical protein